MTRREFLRLSILYATATVLAACAPAVPEKPPATPSPIPSGTIPPPTLVSPRSPTPLATLSPTPLPTNLADRLRIFKAGYPRGYFFRIAEDWASNEKIDYAQWERTFNRLLGIEGKTMDEEIPGRGKRDTEFFVRFKQQHPDQLVLVHYNGDARDPGQQENKFFAGHWLYFNGAKITADIAAENGETEIQVSDASLFRTNMGRYNSSNEDVGLCELDAQGQPNWLASEQVQLVSVDARNRTIRVKRGAYGTPPRAFKSNRAYAAAHCTEGPWSPKANLLWFYNYATTCPRDANGKSCGDVLAQDLAERFQPGSALEPLDGIEFDVLFHSLTGNPRGRAPDANADGVADVGLVDNVNVYGNGVVEFCRQLRKLMGENRLVMADGWLARNQRAFGILNGIESEGWPSLFDSKIDDWSGGLNRQAFWIANSRAPRFSYINHKFQSGDSDFNGHAQFPYATHRLVFAGAAFTDSAICYALVPTADKGELTGIWDELWMGQEQKIGWLGQPLAPAVHLAEKQNDLLARLTREELASRFKGAGVNFSLDGDAIKTAAGNPSVTAMQFSVTLPANGPDWLIRFSAQAAALANAAPEVARLVQMNLPGSDPSPAWVNQNAFTYFHYRSDVRGDSVELNFGIEGGAALWLSNISVFAYPDVMYREFENGLVLANPSLRPYAFDLSRLFPSKSWRKFKGSGLQDMQMNDGAAVGGMFSLGPRDAIFLVKN
jgi:hypothetical protein